MIRPLLLPGRRSGQSAEPEQDHELSAMLAAASDYANEGASSIQLYEQDLAVAFNVSEAVAVSSDSATIIVLCGALGLERGSAILIAGSATRPWIMGGFTQAGVRVVLARGRELDGLAGLYGAVLVVSDGKNARELKTARRAADRFSCPLVVDITTLTDTSVSTTQSVQCGDICIFASDGGKRISTGEGGVILTRDSALADKARTYARFGGLDGVHMGVNHKLSPVQAALGRVRLRASYSEPKWPPSLKVNVETGDRSITDVRISDRFDPTSLSDAAELARALRGSLDGSGLAVRAYEQSLSLTFGAPYAFAVSSGYAAVLIALSALGLKAGDEVLLTPTCPLCTVFALTAIGVNPIFCDTRADSFSIDLDQAAARIGPNTRAILEIPMWGYPVPAHEVAEFSSAHGLGFILDLALGHGTELRGQHIWRYADIATFSTHASKMLVTGEGGFVLAHRADIAESIVRARHYGGRSAGVNYRLAGPQAALGSARLPVLADHIRRRRDTMAEITTGLRNPHLEPFPICADGKPAGVKLLVRERWGRGNALNEHLAQAGIPSDIRTYNCRPLYEFPVLRERGAQCPNATNILSSIATLPVHPDIGPSERSHILNCLNSYNPEVA